VTLTRGLSAIVEPLVNTTSSLRLYLAMTVGTWRRLFNAV